jgi:hypothetical protein
MLPSDGCIRSRISHTRKRLREDCPSCQHQSKTLPSIRSLQSRQSPVHTLFSASRLKILDRIQPTTKPRACTTPVIKTSFQPNHLHTPATPIPSPTRCHRIISHTLHPHQESQYQHINSDVSPVNSLRR